MNSAPNPSCVEIRKNPPFSCSVFKHDFYHTHLFFAYQNFKHSGWNIGSRIDHLIPTDDILALLLLSTSMK